MYYMYTSICRTSGAKPSIFLMFLGMFYTHVVDYITVVNYCGELATHFYINVPGRKKSKVQIVVEL